ncbi:MAG: hypothetical protein ABFC96_06280 [Thermoguttaceae bacterium]
MPTTDPTERIPEEDGPAYIQPVLSWALILVLIVLLVAGGFLLAMRQFFHGMVAGNPGPVTSASQWPKPLQQLTSDAKRERIQVLDLEVQCMCKGMETEYVWRMRLTPQFFDFLEKRWKLSPVPRSEHGIYSGRSMYSGEKTPEWWSPMQNENAKFYESERLSAAARAVPEGTFGDQFRVAVDADRQVIFVHYHEKW